MAVFSREGKEKRERILALDLLRGTFLVVIFINHMAWSPTLYDVLTGQSHLFASAAEGFFVISGMLVGYIYAERILSQTKQTFIRLFKRAGWLYLLSIGFTTLYTLITLFLPPDTVRGQYLSPSIGEFIWNTLTLQLNYGWADFLSRYAIFMVFAPFAIWLAAKKLSWLLALISIAVWYFLGSGPFAHITAWQLIFCAGIIIGYHLPAIEKWVKSWPSTTKRLGKLTLVTTAVFTFAISIILTVILPIIAGEYQHILSPTAFHNIVDIINVRTSLDLSIFARENLALGRILIGTLWFTTLYIIYRQYESAIDKKTKGTLLLLGTNSLYVYGLQSFILFMMDIFLKQPEGASILLKTLVVTNALFLVYVLTYKRTSIRRFRRKVLKV